MNEDQLRRINPHVRYLLFGWLGVSYGFAIGYYTFKTPISFIPIFMIVGAAIGGLIVTAICQNHWFKKNKKVE